MNIKDYKQHHQVLEKVLQDHFGVDGEVSGIEIGTYCGDSARIILRALPKCKLITMDPWIHRDLSEYEAGEPQSYHDGNRELALSRLMVDEFKDRLTVLHMTSEDAHEVITKQMGIEKVDFVWVDGNHEVPAFKKDIELYEPMVKEGGIFGGHDFGMVGALTEVIFKTYEGKIWSGPDFAWWTYK
jgi:predicted O-methyltransferase YrrM